MLTQISAKCSAGGLHLLGLGSASESVLLSSLDFLEVSSSAGSGLVSSDGLDGPVVSSSLGMGATSGLGILLVLLVEVGSSGESTDHVRVSSSLSCCGGSSRLHKRRLISEQRVSMTLTILFED